MRCATVDSRGATSLRTMSTSLSLEAAMVKSLGEKGPYTSYA